MRKRTLRDINAEILNLTEALEHCEDETEETAIMDALDALAQGRDQKLDNIAYVRLEQKAAVKSIGEEIKRLQSRKTAIENAGKRLDEYVKGELARTGQRSHRGELATLSIAKSPYSCEVIDAERIPEAYTEEVTETKIKRADAIAHFKRTGEVIDGFRFFQNEHVRYK